MNLKYVADNAMLSRQEVAQLRGLVAMQQEELRSITCSDELHLYHR